MTGKTWEPKSYEIHGDWYTFKMANKDTLSFHQDNFTMKVE